MKHTRLLKHLLLFNLTLASCISAPSSHNEADPATGEMIVIGETEHLYIMEAEYAYDARIDTGATTCSLHAEDIVPFERDGDQWVTFNLVNFDTKERIELKEKVARVVEIKQHGSDSVSRYVVRLKVMIDQEPRTFEFSLTDRSNYSYPMLVGRNLLRGIATVDVSQSYTLKKPTKKSIAKSQTK